MESCHWSCLSSRSLVLTIVSNTVPTGQYMLVCITRSVMFQPVWPHRQWPGRLLCPWDSPGKNTGVGCHFLLQRIFPTQGLNPDLLHCRQIPSHLSHQGSPMFGTQQMSIWSPGWRLCAYEVIVAQGRWILILSFLWILACLSKP